MATKSPTPAGTTRSSRASRTSSQPCTRRLASIGRRRFTIRLRAGLTRTWILWARMVSFLPMSFRAFTVSFRGFVLGLLGVAWAFPAEPGMVFIPGGEYARGRAHEHSDTNMPYYPNPLRDDRPIKKIHIDPFYLDEAEVTNERYLAFLKATGHRRPYHWVKGQLPEGKEKYPVVNVSWDDAIAFCTWDGG